MARQVPTLSSGTIRKLVSLLTDVGIDPRPLLAEVSLEEDVLREKDSRVPVEKLHRMWDAVLRVAPRIDGALLGAERYAPGDYGLVGFVAMNSATLGEAVRHVVRYVGLWADEPGIDLLEDGTLAV